MSQPVASSSGYQGHHLQPPPTSPPLINSKLAELRARQQIIETNIEILSRLYHFNEKGEYQYPQFLPAAWKDEDEVEVVLLLPWVPASSSKFVRWHPLLVVCPVTNS